jgi:hypothetical protein
MATVGAKFYNLSDYQSRTKLDGSAAAASNILYKMKPLLDNLVMTECNEVNKHRAFICTNLPTAQPIQVGGGVPVDKSVYTNVVETTGAVGLAHRVYADVLQASNNGAAFRAMDGRNCIESVAAAMENMYINGSRAADTMQFDGLKTRLSTFAGELADRVIPGLGTGSVNTSMYFVVSGERLTYGLHPSSFQMGIEANIGPEAYPVELADGRISYVYTDSWKLHGGLMIEDPRSVCRGCNIDVANLKSGTGDDDLFSLMYDCYSSVKKVLNYGGAKPFILVNPTLLKYLNKQARSNVTFSDLSIESREGVQVTSSSPILKPALSNRQQKGTNT